MLYKSIHSVFASFALAGLVTPVASATTFPVKPVKIVVNTGPGGLVDLSTRLIAEKMSEKLGQPVIVENRPGGATLIGTRAIKNAPADGYTLLSTAGTVTILPAVKRDPGYQINDFTGIGPILRSPLLMVTSGSGPYKTLADFVKRASTNPGKMSYASGGVGTTTQIGAALFIKQAGLDLLHIPYNGNGPAIPDVIAGRVDTIFEAYSSGAPQVKSGTLRALAVTSTVRLPNLPDVPTLQERGIKDFSYYLWTGMLAPKGTPQDVVSRLSEALHYALDSKELGERFRSDGAEPMLMQPIEFNQFLQQEASYFEKVVTELGIEKQ
ncbi:putative Bug-like extracytoplasmic solute binding receptor, TTT family [Advenella mimigardefordensis DPN7]|uniref:Putative Bug-like extracytoplasmic solute binding receptor, TTT family n=2 Tax=Advenella mimigardefordensis TaxID=302406 RepID=W0PEZ1_ADVMD|nr:putative Bug-like extracytoplasmic solute binding receptor, TTT family [Advenella mimigardefordensis DPN7]